MPELEWSGWLIVVLAAFLVGVAKTGILGVGVVAVILMAEAMDARVSVGVMLPLLIFADVFAAAYYRRSAQWRYVLRLIPWAFIGIVIGALGLKVVSGKQLRPIIGGIVFTIVAVNFWWSRRKGNDVRVPEKWWFAAGLGLLAGITTMMANAAGPIMIIYLLAMRLPKNEFVGTGAWYFLIMNWVKVPFSRGLGLINIESLKLNLALFPFILVGVVVGILVLKRIPQKAFSLTVEILAIVAALYLLASPLIEWLKAS